MTSQRPPDDSSWEPTAYPSAGGTGPTTGYPASPYPPAGANPYAPQGPHHAGPPYQNPPYQNPYAAQGPHHAVPPYQNPPYQNPVRQQRANPVPESALGGGGPKASHRTRNLVVLAAIVVLAAGGVGAVLFTKHKSQSTPIASIAKPPTGVVAPPLAPSSAGKPSSVGSAPTSGASTATGDGSAGSPATTVAPQVNGGAGAALPVEADGWRLDSTTFETDTLGDFGGSVKVTYIGAGSPTTDATIFDIAVFVHGKQVANLAAGPVGGLTGGQKTLGLLSGDPRVPGPYTYTLQVNSL